MVQRREDEYSLVDLVMLRKIQRKVLSKEKREYEIRSTIFWNSLFSHNAARPGRISGKAVRTTYPYPQTTASKRTYDRSVIVKVSYKTFRKGNVSAEMKQKIQTNTAECIEYFLRFEDSLAFNEKYTGITKEELKEQFRNDAVFKIMVSPEDPELLTENYIRKIVSFIELHTRHHLKWAAVFHDNTEHPHAHIMISRTSGDGLSWSEPLVLDKDFISHGLRTECQRIATKKLGRKSIDEYRIPFYNSIEMKGLARIDHIIAGATKNPDTGLFIPSSEDSFILSRARLAELPSWQQELVIKRLIFLSENTDAGFRKEGGYWKCYKPYTWKEELMDTAKTEPFRQLEKIYGTKIEVVGSGKLRERIDGEVIGHTIVDDNSECIGLVVKTTDDKLFYTETNMPLLSAESVDGKSAEITEKEAKDKRYRTAVVKIADEDSRGDEAMKKIAALILVEMIIILALLLAMNMFMFRRISVSFSGVVFMFRMAARSGFRIVSFKAIAFLFVIVVFFTVQLVFMYQATRKAVLDFRNRNMHSSGTARWATTKELKKLGLISKEPEGVILGQSSEANGIITGSDSFEITRFGQLISDSSAYHAIIVGATGSGKGVGVIMPTLLTWKESVMVVDPKGESYDYTAGYRSTFSEVFYFDPTINAEEAKARHIKPCHINPLDFIPRTSEAVAEIGNMCLSIHPDQSKEAYWDKTPRMMLEMLIGHVLIKGKKKSLPEAASLIMTSEKYETIFENILNAYDDDPVPESDPLHDVAAMVQNNAALFFQMATGQNAEQLVTHISTVKGDLGVYSNSASAELLSYSDFSLDDIMDGEKPISIYMCIPVKQIERIMPMFKLIYSLILKSFLGRDQQHRHKLLLLLDEFSQFKKFETIAEQIPFVRSYGIKIMAFIQSISQLDEYYGHDGEKALMDNFQLKVYLKATSPETTEYFEKQLGKKTLLMKKTSFSHNRKSQGVESYSESTSEQGRALLTADEILNLPLFEMMIFRPGMYPYLCKKIQYYADKRFKDKLSLPVQPTTIKPFTHDEKLKPEFPTELTEEEFRSINRFTLELQELNKAEAEMNEEVDHNEDFFASVLDDILASSSDKSETEEPEQEEPENSEETAEATEEAPSKDDKEEFW